MIGVRWRAIVGVSTSAVVESSTGAARPWAPWRRACPARSCRPARRRFPFGDPVPPFSRLGLAGRASTRCSSVDMLAQIHSRASLRARHPHFTSVSARHTSTGNSVVAPPAHTAADSSGRRRLTPHHRHTHTHTNPTPRDMSNGNIHKPRGTRATGTLEWYGMNGQPF